MDTEELRNRLATFPWPRDITDTAGPAKIIPDSVAPLLGVARPMLTAAVKFGTSYASEPSYAGVGVDFLGRHAYVLRGYFLLDQHHHYWTIGRVSFFLFDFGAFNATTQRCEWRAVKLLRDICVADNDGKLQQHHSKWLNRTRLFSAITESPDAARRSVRLPIPISEEPQGYVVVVSSGGELRTRLSTRPDGDYANRFGFETLNDYLEALGNANCKILGVSGMG